jgi:hypothetical protein
MDQIVGFLLYRSLLAARGVADPDRLALLLAVAMPRPGPLSLVAMELVAGGATPPAPPPAAPPPVQERPAEPAATPPVLPSPRPAINDAPAPARQRSRAKGKT